VQLPDRVLVYETVGGDSLDMHYKLKEKILRKLVRCANWLTLISASISLTFRSCRSHLIAGLQLARRDGAEHHSVPRAAAAAVQFQGLTSHTSLQFCID
jgi:hypothetical protein